jgi:hypothetical protein
MMIMGWRRAGSRENKKGIDYGAGGDHVPESGRSSPAGGQPWRLRAPRWPTNGPPNSRFAANQRIRNGRETDAKQISSPLASPLGGFNYDLREN